MAPRNAVPQYRLLADNLIRRIRSGELPPGTLLPTEQALGEQFRVSRITHLVDRGMPLQDVQELAGHTSINTTRSYYRNTLENVKHSYLKAAQ